MSLSSEELRSIVREVLHDALPTFAGAVVDPGAESVRLASDADLDAFVRRLAALCDQPEERAALRDGRRRFRLAGAPPGPAASAASRSTTVPALRVERGAVTERIVNTAAADGARLSLGRGAVLTPLARDRARVLGVEIERDR